MTPKQMALYQLARHALNAASESTLKERAGVCHLVAAALCDECPDMAALAAATASHFSAAEESGQLLLSHLTNQPQPTAIE